MKITRLLKAATAAAAITLLMGSAVSAVTLNLHNGADPRTLDPAKASGVWEDRPISDMIEGLMTLDAKGQVINGQAASYEVSADGLVYTFKIRDDAFWSDGTPVTAKDFVTGIQRLANPATASKYAYLLSFVKGFKEVNSGAQADLSTIAVKAIDDKTVEYTLDTPAAFFLGSLTHYTAFPVPTHVVEQFGEDWSSVEHIVGNGSYVVKEWVAGSHLRAAKNDKYYDAANVKIDEVVYHIQEDLPAALNRYRAGDFDILSSFPPDQLAQINQQNPGEAHVSPFLGIHYYVMNQSEGSVLADQDIRKALSISVNRDVIGPEIWTTGEPAGYGWVPAGTKSAVPEAYVPDWAATPYEDRVAEAKSILESKGYNAGNPLTIQLRYNTSSKHEQLATAIAAMWSEIGVKVEMNTADTGTHYTALEVGDFQVGRAGWLLDFDDPTNTLDLLKCGVEVAPAADAAADAKPTINWGNNYGRWCNPDYDALLGQAAVELDVGKRADILRQAEKLAMDSFAAMPLAYYVSNWVVSPKVSGFEDNAADKHYVRWLSKAE